MNPAVAALRAQETEPRRQLIDCAHANCMSSAICRVKRKHGWANLCEFHYTNDNLDESREYCKKNGLNTIEKKIAHIQTMLKKQKDFRAWMIAPKSEIAREYADKVLGRVSEREPGQDDEEREYSEVEF